MYFYLDKIYNEINKYDYITIYGTGLYAKIIYPKLCLMGLKEKIKSFVVSGKPEKQYIDGIPVYSVIEVEQKTDEVFLLAVSKKWDSEIRTVLKKYELYNYISLCEYERNSERASSIVSTILKKNPAILQG